MNADITPEERQRRILLVVRHAMSNYEVLPTTDRIELLLGLAEILPEAEAEKARSTAFVLGESETHQLNFIGLMRPAQSKSSN